MKNLIIVSACLIVLLFSTNALFAQNDSIRIRKNVVSTHPLLLFTLNPNFYYERLLTSQTSIHFGISYANFNRLNTNSDVDSPYISASAGFRYYFQKKQIGPKGFYLYPRIRYYNILIKSAEDIHSAALELGLAPGYQWVFNSNLTLDAYLGIQTAVYQTGIQNELTKTSPLIGVLLGYNF
jgi:hypothetical protein